jgi:hypothetical protein
MVAYRAFVKYTIAETSPSQGRAKVLLLFGDPPDASLPELANYRLKATRTTIPRLLAAPHVQGSPESSPLIRLCRW